MASDPETHKISSDSFFNREVSWLRFNERVLDQACDPRVPLLERITFLSIYTSNLDEFFMKRVGGLKRRIAAGVMALSHDGLTPSQQLAEIRRELLPSLERAQGVYVKEIKPGLVDIGVDLVSATELSELERHFVSEYFQNRVFPLLTPLAVDSGQPFPLLSNLSTSLGVALSRPDRDEPLFARVKVSGFADRWLLLPCEGDRGPSRYRFIGLTDVIQQHIDLLFPNMTILSAMPFRVTRNADLELDEEDLDSVEDVRDLIEEELRLRRFAKVVRLEHGPDPDPWIVGFLRQEFSLDDSDVYQLEAHLDFTTMQTIAKLPLPDHKHTSWAPVVPIALQDEPTVFHAMRAKDILVHHPYESFSTSVERFMREATRDPLVRSIKMTIYRLGDETPFIPLMIEAAESGKEVVCLVELKARFDEERNLHWAEKLEQAGVHVIYGPLGYKVHAKVLLVIREEPEGFRAYAHTGTGNYHSKTANLYTDFGLFTVRPEVTSELVHFFNFLTGRSRKDDYQELLVAPVNMEQRFISMVEREIVHHRAGAPARIIAKMNSLEDRHMIKELYRASQAGVPIDLLIRGLCCLRPGVSGLSENIRVLSVVGRFLEHSRVFYFRNGQEDPLDGEFFMGSADWMGRNLHRRVEVVTPIREASHRERVWELFQVILLDQRQAWELGAEGDYTRLGDPTSLDSLGTHEQLMSLVRARAAQHGFRDEAKERTQLVAP